MKVLVTGARGFIGSFLVEKLIEQGHEVRCLLRNKPGKSWLDGLNIQPVAGDITTAATLQEAVRKVSVIYHLAGCTKSLRQSGFDLVNVAGTRNLLEATRKSNSQINRFVHVSSLAAAGPSPTGELISEDVEPQPVSDYGKSKLGSERVAREFMADLPITIVRPPAVYGPRDKDIFNYFKNAKRGIQPVLSGGSRSASFIFVRDLVAGLLLAAEGKAAIGQTYFLCDDKAYTWDEFGKSIAMALAVRPRRIKLPLSLAYVVCAGSELISRITGKPSIINLDKYRELKMNHWVCSNEKAKRDLGFVVKFGLQQGVLETAEWYLKYGWL